MLSSSNNLSNANLSARYAEISCQSLQRSRIMAKAGTGKRESGGFHFEEEDAETYWCVVVDIPYNPYILLNFV